MAAATRIRPIDQEQARCASWSSCSRYWCGFERRTHRSRRQIRPISFDVDGRPVTPAELAERTGTAERYVREWLNANAASNYLQYHSDSQTYSMTPEQAFILGMDDTPVHLPGFYHMVASCMKDEEKLADTFRNGKGFGWHEHEKGLFEGCERFFRPSYLANLTDKLDSGARRS